MQEFDENLDSEGSSEKEADESEEIGSTTGDAQIPSRDEPLIVFDEKPKKVDMNSNVQTVENQQAIQELGTSNSLLADLKKEAY